MGPASSGGRRYWQADDHQWGQGKTHILDDDGSKMLCGKRLENCPGQPGLADEFDCKTCMAVLEARERRIKEQEEQERRSREYRAKQEEEDRQWLAEHNVYLQTPQWRGKRAKVLRRDQNLCQGCRERPATQVHHLTYKHWKKEPLFDLVAICDVCHDEVTAMDRKRRGY